MFINNIGNYGKQNLLKNLWILFGVEGGTGGTVSSSFSPSNNHFVNKLQRN